MSFDSTWDLAPPGWDGDAFAVQGRRWNWFFWLEGLTIARWFVRILQVANLRLVPIFKLPRTCFSVDDPALFSLLLMAAE